MVPSGRVMRTPGGRLAPGRGGSMKVARKPKSVGHFFGFLAVAAFPSALSTRAYARSPSRPRSVTSVAVTSSPSIDLTGYRHSDARSAAGPHRGQEGVTPHKIGACKCLET